MALPFKKEVILEAIQQVLAEHETDPALELTVGDYQTKHYHMCPGAKTLYQDIENKVEDMDLAVRTAKLQDALFAMEEMALERGATEADLFAAETLASQIMSMAQMMGLEKEHSYIQGHVDKIKGAVGNVDEESTFITAKDGETRVVDLDDKGAAELKKDPNITGIETAKGRKLKETLSVGHIDDEPGMLKQFAFDTAEYAVKLYKLLREYEQMEEQVDFPNWWQHKVMMAREYMSKATHYLEFETMEPQIDAAVDGHSEEELAEDYVPRTKEDLVFQYLRDAWQFGATKGRDVNPDEELSTMADSLLANLPDYDAAELDEIKKAEFEKIKPGKELQLRGYGVVKVIENDGIVMKIKDSLDKVHTINLGQYNEKFLKEARKRGEKTVRTELDATIAKMKELAKRYKEGDKSVVPTLKDLTARKKALSAELEKIVAGIGAGQEYKGEVDERIAEGVSCCGRCGRVHESAQDCKKPYISKDSPRHCKNKK